MWPKKTSIIPLTSEGKVAPMTVGETPPFHPSTQESDVAERIRQQTAQYREREAEREDRKLYNQLLDAKQRVEGAERRNQELERELLKKEEEQARLKMWLLAITRKISDMGISIEEAEEARAFLVEEAFNAKKKPQMFSGDLSDIKLYRTQRT